MFASCYTVAVDVAHADRDDSGRTRRKHRDAAHDAAARDSVHAPPAGPLKSPNRRAGTRPVPVILIRFAEE